MKWIDGHKCTNLGLGGGHLRPSPPLSTATAVFAQFA